VVADVFSFLTKKVVLALERGVERQQRMLDPGPDFAKTPAQTIDVLGSLDALAEFGRPVLLAVSRKDFIGALTGREPRERLAGTLAAIGHCVDAGAHVLRVHDVAAVRDFLTVRGALRGDTEVDPALALSDAVRWQQGDKCGAI
ncbi:MAG: dihydropteroate synthase, partial [Solirubrobacteraceae bacterium]